MLFRFNRLTLLANIVSLQFTEISEYQPSSSYRASKSRFSPYIHCKFCRVFPTTKMASATVKPSLFDHISKQWEESWKYSQTSHKRPPKMASSIGRPVNYQSPDKSFSIVYSPTSSQPLLALSLQGVSLWRANLSGIRQSKIVWL